MTRLADTEYKTLIDNHYPKFAKYLYKAKRISKEDFLELYGLNHFNKSSFRTTGTLSDVPSKAPIEESVAFLKAVAFPRTPSVVASGVETGFFFSKLSSLLDEFMFNQTELSPVTAGARSKVDTDSILMDLINNKLVTVQVVSEPFKKGKSKITVFIYKNDEPIYSLKELEQLQESLNEAFVKRNLEWGKVLTPKVVTQLTHDSNLVAKKNNDLVLFGFLTSPKKLTAKQKEELDRILLLLDIVERYTDYLKPDSETTLLINFFHQVKKD